MRHEKKTHAAELLLLEQQQQQQQQVNNEIIFFLFVQKVADNVKAKLVSFVMSFCSGMLTTDLLKALGGFAKSYF